MFGKKNAAPQIEMPNTVIGKGITLKSSLLTGKESVRIDGMLYGDVDLDGSLILGDTGCIEGTLKAKYIIIAGQVMGNIHCGSVVHLSSTARVTGNIETQSIIVDEGAQLNGRYQVGAISSVENVPLLPNAAPEAIPGETDHSIPDVKSYLERYPEILEKREADGA